MAKQTILVPRDSTPQTTRLSFQIDAQLARELRDLEAAAEAAGFEIPTVRLVQEALRKVVRAGQRELAAAQRGEQ